MQALEFKRKAGWLAGTKYGLGITLAPSSDEDLIQEMGSVRAALVEWKDRHGKSCETVMFTIVCDPSLHSFVKELLETVYEGEEIIGPILESVTVLVSLLDASGKPKEEYRLGA